MKPRKTERRKRHMRHTPPPHHRLSRFDKSFLWFVVAVILYHVYAYSFNNQVGFPWMLRHGLVYPHVWIMKHFSVPAREAVAQTGEPSGPQERIIFLHGDASGRAILMTDQTGQVVNRPVWEPFGKPPGNSSGATNLGYPGQYYDKETGLYYNSRRNYDPSTGRYLEPDPVIPSTGTRGTIRIGSSILTDRNPFQGQATTHSLPEQKPWHSEENSMS
jgi:RHS repeat-associated protein